MYGTIESFNDSLHEPPEYGTIRFGSPHQENRFLINESQAFPIGTVFSADYQESSEFQQLARDLRSFKQELYYAGYFYYVNLVNKQKSRYEFVIGLQRTSFYIFHNRNVRLNEKVDDD